MRRRGVIAGAVAAGVLALGGMLGSSSGGGVNVYVGNNTIPTPPADTANLWVDTTGGTCTRQATPSAYSDAAACGSLGAAQTAASGGDTVRIKDGTYGAQTLSGAKASLVTYIGESKAGTVFTDTVTLPSRVKLQDLTITSDAHAFYALSLDGTTGVRLQNVDMEGDYVSFHPSNVTDLQYVGGRFADLDGTLNLRRCSGPADDEPLWIAGGSDVLIEGVNFGDTGGSPDGQGGCVGDSAHVEMLRIDQGATDVIIRKNVFNDNNANTATIFLSNFGGRPVRPKLVGNIIGDSNVPVNWGGGACTDLTIAYNTVNYLGDFTGCSSTTGTKIVGNVASKPSFAPPDSGAATWTSNVMQANGNISYVGTWVSGPDFSMSNLGLTSTTITGPSSAHLQAGSPAINAGEAPGASDACTDPALWGTSTPTDIDGDPRPSGGSNCDAGADEYTGG